MLLLSHAELLEYTTAVAPHLFQLFQTAECFHASVAAAQKLVILNFTLQNRQLFFSSCREWRNKQTITKKHIVFSQVSIVK